MSHTTEEQETEQGKQPVQLLIRLWHGRSKAHSEGNEHPGSRAQMLVEDVLGFTLEARTGPWHDGYVCASGINNLSRTLAASRALQQAFEGFRATVPSARTTISVVVDRPISGESEALPSSPSLELTSLLDITRPGQVLITQSFYKFVDSGQPLQLRSFPARAGAYEWLWTSGKRLDQLQSDPDFRPMLAGEPQVVEKKAVMAPASPASTMNLRTPKIGTSKAGSNRFHIGNLRPLHKLAAAAALAVAVAVGTWSYLRPTRQSNQRVRSASPVVVPPKGLVTEIDQPGPSANIPLSRESLRPFIPRPRPEPKTPPRQGCSIADQIPRYLAMAESNRNRGQCVDAIRQYDGVLACEPGNREARQGLERALEDKRLNLCR